MDTKEDINKLLKYSSAKFRRDVEGRGGGRWKIFDLPSRNKSLQSGGEKLMMLIE